MSLILFRVNPWLTGFVLLATMLAAWGLGMWLGHRQRRRLAGKVPGGGKIEDACLALLGLLLAFSFATAYGKFDLQRISLVEEANAISTFAENAQLLPEPQRSRVRELVLQYVHVRLKLGDLEHHPIAWERWDEQVRGIGRDIERQVMQAAQQMPPSSVLSAIVSSLDEVGDRHEARISVLMDHVPYAIMAVLFVSSVICAWMLGRAHGITEDRRPLMTVVFLVLVAFVTSLTLDLDQPHHGLITVSDRPLTRLAEELEGTPWALRFGAVPSGQPSAIVSCALSS